MLAHVFVDGEEARQHPRDVPVDEPHRLTERDARDGPRRVGTDAGHPQKAFAVRRERASERDHRARAFVEHSCATVVPEPTPHREHVVGGGIGERERRRKALQKARVIRQHRLHARLLEHDFAHPNGVRIPRSSPGKIASARLVPTKQCVMKRLQVRRTLRDAERRHILGPRHEQVAS